MLNRLFSRILPAAACLGVATASFVAPVEKNPPFRRDRLPINSDLMISLSRDLTALSLSTSLAKAEQRRSAAQALALAIALDPANRSARDILSALSDGEELERPDSAKIETAKTRIWKSYEWLSLPQAGADGNVLASLLEEPAYVLDSDRQKPSNSQANAMAWDGWVAPISAFKEEVASKDVDPFDSVGTKKEQPEKNPLPKGNGAIALRSASIESVIHTYDEPTEKWKHGLYPVKMEASDKAPESDDDSLRSSKSFEINIRSSSSESFRIRSNIIDPIEEALADRLPDKGEIKILPGINGSYSYRRNHSRLSGPGFILANSALTGIEPDGIVLAELGDDGNLKRPTYFWWMISEISEVEGKRIILPKGSEEFLVNLLILGKPEFFLENEVLLGSSNENFIALCAKQRTPEQEEIHARFKEIADKGKDSPLGPYLTNRFVRQRLEEIVSAAPYHMSAKMLVLQGSPVRPRYLSKEVLAAEVWKAIDPVESVIRSGLDPSDSKQLDKVYDNMREEIEKLERYADLRSQDVVSNGKELLSKMRSYMRNLRGSEELWERYDEIYAARTQLIKTNAEVRAALSKLSGDPLPEDLNDLRRTRRNEDR